MRDQEVKSKGIYRFTETYGRFAKGYVVMVTEVGEDYFIALGEKLPLDAPIRECDD